MLHNAAGHERPERDREKADEVIKAEGGVEEIIADEIAQERLRESLARRDGGAVHDEIRIKCRGDLALPSEPETRHRRNDKRRLNNELAVVPIGQPAPYIRPAEAADLDEHEKEGAVGEAQPEVADEVWNYRS